MASAYLYRMNAGYPGDVNRTHPASIDTALMDATNPPTLYGQPCLINAATGGVRSFLVADQQNVTPAAAWGVTARAFPIQQALSGTPYGGASIGTAAIGSIGEVGTLKAGYIIGAVPAGQSPVKGGAVYVWCAASTGLHVLGGFESVYSAGNTTVLSNAVFNGGADSSGNVEIAFNI